MKPDCLALATLSVTSLIALAPLPASAQNAGWYLRGDAGGQWTMDTDLREFFGEPGAPGSKVEFDPGARVGFAAGYWVTDWFAAEAQTAIMANNIDSIGGENARGDAVFSNIPLLLNARFECPALHCITPYFGAGLGLSTSVISTDDLIVGATEMDGSDADVVFAYQAFGGLRYRLNDRMGLSLEYRYVAAGAPSWEAESTAGTGSDRLRFDDIETHAVSVVFDLRF